MYTAANQDEPPPPEYGDDVDGGGTGEDHVVKIEIKTTDPGVAAV